MSGRPADPGASPAEPTGSAREPPTSLAGLAALAERGFVFGYPLVVTARTFATFANLIGCNRVFNQQARSDARTRLIVAPNVDTLYSVAVIDTRSGPVRLTLPEIAGRYHTFQFLDATTESFAYLGTRTTGGRSGVWWLCPPGWSGDVPDGVARLDLPTPQVFMLGRVLVTDDTDVEAVTALTGRVELGPALPGAPEPPAVSPAPGPAHATGTDGPGFWDELGEALALNPPPTAAQQALVEELGVLGVGPERKPSAEADPMTSEALAQGIRRGTAVIDRAGATVAPVNGWRIRTDIGTYGDDLTTRALVARVGWGANVPEEALYPVVGVDGEGRQLHGRHRYRLRFAPGQWPPVEAFWSLTLYGPDLFFVPNPWGRHAVGDALGNIEAGPDGSLELAIAPPDPGNRSSDAPANWLPAPDGPFVLMLRLYLPRPELLEGRWAPPPVERLGP